MRIMLLVAGTLEALAPNLELWWGAARAKTARDGDAPSRAAIPPTVRAAAIATEPAIRSWKLRSTWRRSRGARAMIREIIALLSGCWYVLAAAGSAARKR